MITDTDSEGTNTSSVTGDPPKDRQDLTEGRSTDQQGMVLASESHRVLDARVSIALTRPMSHSGKEMIRAR
jgi:hypothetical protein